MTEHEKKELVITTVCIKNVPAKASKEQLERIFSTIGSVQKAGTLFIVPFNSILQ